MIGVKRLLIFFVFFIAVAWGAGFVHFLMQVPKTVPQDAAMVDAVVVFTGGASRVPVGLELAEERQLPVLVSGVNAQVSAEDLLSPYAFDPAFEGKISLDYAAHTTRENVWQTIKWVQNQQISRIMLVTSFYHMPRSLMLLKDEAPQLRVMPYAVHAEGDSLGIVVREYHKYMLMQLGLV